MLTMNKLRAVFLGLVFLCVLSPFKAISQTESQLDESFPHVKAYAVRPNIFLTAKFGNDGRVCQMVLEPRRYTDEVIVLVSNLSKKETVEVIEEIVPESDRGRKVEHPKWLESDIAGGVITTTYQYENMTIQFHGSVRQQDSDSMVATVTWPQRSCAK